MRHASFSGLADPPSRLKLQGMFRVPLIHQRRCILEQRGRFLRPPLSGNVVLKQWISPWQKCVWSASLWGFPQLWHCVRRGEARRHRCPLPHQDCRSWATCCRFTVERQVPLQYRDGEPTLTHYERLRTWRAISKASWLSADLSLASGPDRRQSFCSATMSWPRIFSPNAPPSSLRVLPRPFSYAMRPQSHSW